MVRLVILLLLLTPSGPWVNAITIANTNAWNARATTLQANLSRESYGMFVNTLRRPVVYEIVGGGELYDRPYLPQQWFDRPRYWIILTLMGRGDARTQIAIRGDNFYVVGFTNKNGQWYEFEPEQGKRKLIPQSILLNFGGSYQELLGYVNTKLKLQQLELSPDLFLRAINTLHSNPDNISEDELKMAITRIIIMISEASRLIPIRNRIVSAWRNNNSIYLTPDEIKYLVTWSNVSMFIMCESVNLRWTNQRAVSELQSMGINSLNDALGIVDIILWPGKFNWNKPRASCG